MLNRNFCSIVAKRRRACSTLNIYLRNMVTGKELVTGRVDQTLPQPGGGDSVRRTGRKFGFSLRKIAKWYGVIKSRVPVGYEDEEGFHYGANLAGWFF